MGSMGGMIPACSVRFVLDPKSSKSAMYKGQYIKQDLIAKYLTKNITSLRTNKLKNSVVEESGKKDVVEEAKPKKKAGKMTAAEFKAMKRKKALENKLRKLNAQ